MPTSKPYRLVTSLPVEGVPESRSPSSIEPGFTYYVAVDPAIASVEGVGRISTAAGQAFLIQNVEGWEPNSASAQNFSSPTSGNDGAGTPVTLDQPTDPRLTYITLTGSDKEILSFSAQNLAPLAEGFILPLDPNDPGGALTSAQNLESSDLVKHPGIQELNGVPALMNPNAYISFQFFKASKDASIMARLIDQPNQPRWYEVDQENSQRAHRYKSPTVTEIVNWSQEGDNPNIQPYRFQDFAYCKYWQKIPNNYLITLRRFPYPTTDSLAPPKEVKNPESLRPVSTAVTWLGESTGNKISSILGPIESGLNWKDLKAEVNEVTPGTSGDAGDGPFPGIAKFLGLVTGEKDRTNAGPSGAPPDPYNDGPWNNKIIGNVNVINSVKARERGLKFEHKISLVFEYSARSIGGVNTKAAMLDIMSNLLLLTSASAPFWGGMNRYMPSSEGQRQAFFGGEAGRAAWLSGNPSAFLEAVTNQFAKAADAISDFLFQAVQDPIEALKSLASGGAKVFMKNSVSSRGSFATGIRAILTGEPVGEWHVVVGNPFNPMMMIGNLICTGIKIEFNEELGPDDFPTEIKATIDLEHGMPRDRDGIESMFNAGGGRLYSLPPGYEENISSSNVTTVDAYTKRKGDASNSNQTSANGQHQPGGRFYRGKSVLFGDPSDVDRAANVVSTTGTRVYSQFAAKWGLGYNKTTNRA
jgi:hypothetical protein